MPAGSLSTAAWCARFPDGPRRHWVSSVVQFRNGRPDQRANQRDHFIGVALLAGKIVERLEARQRVEYRDHLLQIGLATRLVEPAEDGADPFPSPFVSRAHRRLKITVDPRQPEHTWNYQPVRGPEGAKRGNQLVQGLAWICRQEYGMNAINQTSCGEIVKERFEQAALGPELIEDGHARDAGPSGDGVDGEPGKIAWCGQQVPGRSDDSAARLLNGRLTLPKPIWP